MAERTLDPDLLRSFVAIAETGSFTDAAARVLRTQSAVSMQMKRLEETLGRAFFVKVGRNVELSLDGEMLLPQARRLLQAHADLVALFDADRLGGSVKIGAPDDYVTTFLPGILTRFAQTHPMVEVEMICESSDRLVTLFDKGDIDLALTTTHSIVPTAREVHRESVVWVAMPGHSPATARPLPLALFHRGCCFRAAALAALAEASITARIAYTSISLAGVVAAIETGSAIGVMMRSTVPSRLRILTEADGLPRLPEFGIALLKHERRGPAVEAMERHIAASFGPHLLRLAS
ncbi:DNA-binding transcriptional regulator, LysR family [Arboricoccus pini]|uniref:DNA-binding transcriptional regulator, LysR family n=1 Tax=Arboricoccus pini TaxID=1963835 RepID=A0A212QZL7_9PROT|nr:LysR substrate-binding domain-containing protein [Arboricoccus pini]SNB65040.1 DNA-binding transcriptional regulator, LysR family [Arboricoccus pini]